MRVLACAFVTFANVGFAMQKEQHDPRLQRFVGAWRGEGTLELMAGARTVPWRGASEFEWVVGGAFLRQRLWLEPSDAIPNGIEAEGLYAWRSDRKRYDLLWVDSLGHLRTYLGQWSDEATFVAADLSRFAGLPRVDRQVVRVDPQGGFQVEMQAAVGTAPLGNEIVARFVRAEHTEHKPGAVKPGPEMTAFARLARDYTVAVDQPSPRGLRGSLRGAFIAGGVALRCELALSAEDQEARTDAVVFFGWDLEQQRATYAALDRDGTITTGSATWTDADKLVLLGHALGGEPRIDHVAVNFAADGSLSCVHEVISDGTRRIVLRGTLAK